MSHFPVYVLIPENAQDAGLKLKDLLAPYDKFLAVAPYEAECPCVRYRAVLKAQEAAALKYGPIEIAQSQFKRQEAENPVADVQAEWARAMKERDEFVTTEAKRHRESIEPDPDCDECGGKGVVTQTSNENATWDWWQIGGCWADILEDCWKNGSHPAHDGSVAAIRELDLVKLPTPFAIITPDGAWHAKGEMGSDDRISKLDEDWESKSKHILSAHQDCILVVVDCHAA